ncbi:hypothetical protein [Nocardioides maradonensis]
MTVDEDGTVRVTLDGQAYADDRTLTRADLRAVVDEIATDLGCPVRIDLREADGATYTDVHLPTDPPAPAADECAPEIASPSLAGAGFRPGEEVALAYVVARRLADADGTAAINLPPALVAAARSGLVLFGLTSLTVAPVEESS